MEKQAFDDGVVEVMEVPESGRAFRGELSSHAVDDLGDPGIDRAKFGPVRPVVGVYAAERRFARSMRSP